MKRTEFFLKVNPANFIYEKEDNVQPKDFKEFDKLIEQHPAVHTLIRGDKRDQKIAGLKSKVLDTLKVEERKKRDLSCESLKSECSGWEREEGSEEREASTDGRGNIRLREDDEESGQPKKTQRTSRLLLRPPKIVISK